MPMAPPKMSEASVTSFSTTMPKASVTMARLGPRTRSDGAAISTPAAAAMPVASSSDSQGPRSQFVVSSATP